MMIPEMASNLLSERLNIRFNSAKERCAAWLYLPIGVRKDRSHPIIVMAHGVGAIKEMRLDAFAERFCDAGYACLVFDYRHFGTSSGEPRELLDIPSQLQDWRSAVEYARSLPHVDPDRVVVWGTSFGGGHAIVTAAQDSRIAAAIAQCPFTDGPASACAIDFTTNARLALKGLADVVASWLGLPRIRVPVVGRQGAVAMMTSADTIPGYYALIHAAGRFDVPMVPAKIVLQILFHKPGLCAANVKCPILFSVCEGDSVAPARQTLKHAARAPKGEIKLYLEGHFDIYVGKFFERNIVDQIAFVQKHVPVNVI